MIRERVFKNKKILVGIISFIFVLLIVSIVFTLCVFPKLNKLKGSVDGVACENIPLSMRPSSEGGSLEYGFTDIDFYNIVVNSVEGATDSFCNDGLSQSDFNSITEINSPSSGLRNLDGIQNLVSLEKLILGGSNVNPDDEPVDEETVIEELGNVEANDDSSDIAITGDDSNTTNPSDKSNNIESIDLRFNTALKELNLSNSNLSSINLSQNTALEKLYLSNNNLTEINLESNVNLQLVSLSRNKLTGINLTNNHNLSQLYLKNNVLTGDLNLSANTSLNILNVSSDLALIRQKKEKGETADINSLTSIEIGSNNLTDIEFDGNDLTSIDLSNQPNLNYISAYWNNLESVNITGSNGIRSLYLHHNNLNNDSLPYLDLGAKTELLYLSLSDNKLSGSFDVSQNIKLSRLLLTNNNLTGITGLSNLSDSLVELRLVGNRLNQGSSCGNNCTFDVSTLPKLAIFLIGGINQKINYLDLSHNPKLISLWAYSLKLTDIDLTHNPMLKVVQIHNNKFDTVDVSHNPDLETLYVHQGTASSKNNGITSINLENNPKLKDFSASNSRLTELDLSHNPLLESVRISNNDFPRTFNLFSGKKEVVAKNITTAYAGDETYTIDDNSITNYFNDSGELIGLKPGQTTYTINYKYADDKTISINNIVNVSGITTENSNYTINYFDKDINVSGDLLSNVIDNLIITDGYTMELNSNNELVIKDGNNSEVIKYTISDYNLYNLTTSEPSYSIHTGEEKYIEVNGDFDFNVTVDKFSVEPDNYTLSISGNELIVSKDDFEDHYEIRGARIPNNNAHNEVGFYDKKLYMCISKKILPEHVTDEYVLNSDELQSISILDCSNKGITDASGIKLLSNLNTLDLSNNKIENINISQNNSLINLYITNNILTNITLSQNQNNQLRRLDAAKNKLSTIDLNNNQSIDYLDVSNNKLINIAGLDKLNNLNKLFVHNNKLDQLSITSDVIKELSTDNNVFNEDIYLLNSKSINYGIAVNIPYSNTTYSAEDSSIISINNNVITAIKDGITYVYSINPNVTGYDANVLDYCWYDEDANCISTVGKVEYFMKQKIKVYDVKSKNYEIDKNNNEIHVPAGDTFDINKVTVTLSDLTLEKNGDYVLIKDGDKTVGTFTIKIVDKKVTTSVKSTTTSNNVKSTAKKKKNKIAVDPDKDTPTINISDTDVIRINGTKVNVDSIDKAISESKNILLVTPNAEFTIPYVKLMKYRKEFEILYEIRDINKDIFDNGIEVVMLKKLPFNIKISIYTTNDIRQKIGNKPIVYDTNLKKLNLIKTTELISFTTNGNDNYYISSGNTKIINKVINKKTIDIIPYILILIALILITLIIIEVNKDEYKKDNM